MTAMRFLHSSHDVCAYRVWNLGWVRIGPIIYIHPTPQTNRTTSDLSVTFMQLHILLQTDTNRDKLLTLLEPLKRPIQRCFSFPYPYPIKTRSVILRFLSNEINNLQDPFPQIITAMLQ